MNFFLFGVYFMYRKDESVMGIPGMHTTIDYKKLIELQAKQTQEIVSLEQTFSSRGKVKQKSMQSKNKVITKKR